MNKFFLLALSLTCASSLSIAQPTLTAANINPVVNDSFVTVICDTSATVGAGGTNITWHYDTLSTTTNSDSIEIGNVVYANSSVTGYSILSLAAGLIPSTTFNTSTHAIVTPASSLTNFYIESASKLSLSGVYYSTSDNAIYTDPVDVLQFPFTYLTSFTDTYAGLVSYGATTAAAEVGSVTVTGDAYGTLWLPAVPPSTTARSYANALRVHSYQLYRDSANLFGTPVIETDTLETYTWYTPDYHSALLTINTVKGPLVNNKSISYARKQIANHEQVPTLSAIDASLKLYPNPVENDLNIEYTNTTGKESVRISLCDITGREIAVISDDCSAGTQKITYNTGTLAKGVYIVRLSSGTETVNRKIEIQ